MSARSAGALQNLEPVYINRQASLVHEVQEESKAVLYMIHGLGVRKILGKSVKYVIVLLMTTIAQPFGCFDQCALKY